MTDKELADIRARCEAARRGPWSVPAEESSDYYCGGWEVEHERSRETYTNVAQMIGSREDATFIAHARSDIPALLDEVELLRKALKSIGANSCCAPCREAGLVANAALDGLY